MTTKEKLTRKLMYKYWQNFQPCVESMMLDPEARILDMKEQQEILGFLPDVTGKTVLELGAGIGRFTGALASSAKHVTAVDFIDSYIEENRSRHGSKKNIDFICADVMSLNLISVRYDLIFSNWLLMYLSEEECLRLLQKALIWLKDEGYLFIRESCFKPSGGIKRTTNPTFYRTPSAYNSLLTSVQQNVPSSRRRIQYGNWGFEVEMVSSVKTYIEHKNNSCQVCFLASKMPKEQSSSVTYDSFQQFLDEQQYSKKGVQRYEWIFGETYLSTGGEETTKEFVQQLKLKPGDNVLDVGSGTGGHSFFMAENYDVKVHGVDLSVNMMSVALEHLSKRPHLTSKVQFEICDVTKKAFEENRYDVIYSRDTLLHIGDKENLFRKFLKYLKPGGKLLFTDYSRGDREHSEEFKEYVAQRGYHLLTVNEYGELLQKIGFINVCSKDQTNEFINALQKELNKLQKNKSDFIKEFSEEDYKYLEDGWLAKIRRAKGGDQTWTLCYAEKGSL